MHKLLFLFCLLAPFLLQGQDEPEYIMYHNIIITPDAKNMAAFKENVTAHNKKYHSGGPFHVNMWMVNAGPNFGKWIASMGPQTFADIENVDFPEGHDEDWDNNVAPYITHMEDGGYWQLIPSQSHLIEGFQPRKLVIRVMDFQPGKAYRLNTFLENLAKSHAADPAHKGIARMVYQRRGWTEDGRDKAVVFALNSWAEWDQIDARGIYESLFSRTDWERQLDQFRDVVQAATEEHWQLSVEMSGDVED